MGKKGQGDDGDERILLGYNTGGGVGMLRLIMF
jgi:hypothetical protein